MSVLLCRPIQNSNQIFLWQCYLAIQARATFYVILNEGFLPTEKQISFLKHAAGCIYLFHSAAYISCWYAAIRIALISCCHRVGGHLRNRTINLALIFILRMTFALESQECIERR